MGKEHEMTSRNQQKSLLERFPPASHTGQVADKQLLVLVGKNRLDKINFDT